MPGSAPSLTDFLKLTQADRLILQRLTSRYHEKGYSTQYLLAYLGAIPVRNLICQTLASSRLNRHLRSKKLDAAWERYLTDYARDKNTLLKSQPGIHPLDLVTGHYLYLQANNSVSAEEPETTRYFDYLHQAEKFCSFHAIYRLNSHDLTLIREAINGDASARETINPDAIMQRVYNAMPHGTPACWLIVETSYALADYCRVVKQDMAKARSYYHIMWQNLLLGRWLQPYCRAATHNAYNGQQYPARNILDLPPSEAYAAFTNTAIEQGVSFSAVCRDAMILYFATAGQYQPRKPLMLPSDFPVQSIFELNTAINAELEQKVIANLGFS